MTKNDAEADRRKVGENKEHNSEKMENNVLQEEEATKEYDDREEKYVEEFLYEGIWIKRRRVGT